MTGNKFFEMLERRWGEGKFVCVGLDSDYEKIPLSLHASRPGTAITIFNHEIVKATSSIACAYKLNAAFYEAHGEEGFAALHQTIVDIRLLAPDVPIILDAKRADIGNTNAGYVEEAFNLLRADAITVNPYLGREALAPFLERKDKGIIILCKTSNPGSGEFQNLRIGDRLLYQHVAQNVADEWNENGNCALVVGATYAKELREVRRIIGDMPILIPGIGAQGGDLKKTVTCGQDSHGKGFIINSSRGIIFASGGKDFAEAARREALKLHDDIKACLEEGECCIG